ncbi:MAG: nuclear transport factor 2 family protein [Actinomycetota bacterium]
MCDNSPASPRGRLVRALVEDCWRDQAGLDRMAELLTPGYVHHTPWGDWDYAQFLTGMEHVDSLFTGRTYRVMHLVDDGQLVAAFVKWSATRQSDGSTVDGRGAYHCRLEGDLVAEDWDAFFPSA